MLNGILGFLTGSGESPSSGKQHTKLEQQREAHMNELQRQREARASNVSLQAQAEAVIAAIQKYEGRGFATKELGPYTTKLYMHVRAIAEGDDLRSVSFDYNQLANFAYSIGMHKAADTYYSQAKAEARQYCFGQQPVVTEKVKEEAASSSSSVGERRGSWIERLGATPELAPRNSGDEQRVSPIPASPMMIKTVSSSNFQALTGNTSKTPENKRNYSSVEPGSSPEQGAMQKYYRPSSPTSRSMDM